MPKMPSAISLAMAPPEESKPSKKKYYPTFHIDREDVEGLEHLEVGQTFTVTATLRLKGMMEHEKEDGTVTTGLDVEVRKISKPATSSNTEESDSDAE